MTPEERDELIDRAILEYMQAQDRGQPIPLEEFLARHDIIRPELLSYFGNAAQLKDVLQPFASTIAPDGIAASGSGATSHGYFLKSFGAYVVSKELARGGMGIIYRAYHQPLKRDVAIKVMLADPRTHPSTVVRFLEEAQIIGQLQHPGIAPVHETGTLDDGRPFFVMKLIQGRTLQELLVERTSPQHEVLRFLNIFQHICQTVAYAHSKGVLHRDLKPQNVMVGEFGEVQVMDWGLGKVVTTQEGKREVETIRTNDLELESQAGFALGTYAYMPPEQAQGLAAAVGPASDVYGLGAILCCILTGQPPHNETNAEDLITAAKAGDLQAATARLQASTTDTELVALTLHCLAPDAAARPANAAAVEQAIAAYLNGVQAKIRAAEIQQAQAEVRVQAERRRRKIQLALVGSIAGIVVLLASGLLWYRSDRTLRERDKLYEEARLLSANQTANIQRYHGIMGRHRARFTAKQPGWRTASRRELQEAATIFFENRDDVELRTVMLETECGWEIEEQGMIPLQGGDIAELAAHPDGVHVAVAYAKHNSRGVWYVNIINILEKKIARSLYVGVNLGNHIHEEKTNPQNRMLARLIISQNGRWLIGSTKQGGLLYCWEWNKLDMPPKIIATGLDTIDSVAADEDIDYVYVHNRNAIHRYKLDSGKHNGQIIAQHPLRCGLITRDSYVYLTQQDIGVCRIDTKVFREIEIVEMTTATSRLSDWIFTQDNQLVIGRDNNSFHVINRDNYKVIAQLQNDKHRANFKLSHKWALSKNNAAFALLYDGQILLYDLGSLHLELTYRLPRPDTLFTVAIVGERHLVTAHTDGIRIHAIHYPTMIKVVAPSNIETLGFQCSQRGQKVYTIEAKTAPSGLIEANCYSWKINSDGCERTRIQDNIAFRATSNLRIPIATSSDGQLLGYLSNTHIAGNTLAVWHTDNCEIVKLLEFQRPNPIASLAFAPNNNLVALSEQEIHRWDVATGKLLATYNDLTNMKSSSSKPVWTTAYFHNRRIYIGDSSGMIRIFDDQLSRTVITVPNAKAIVSMMPITQIQAIPDNHRLLVGDSSGAIHLVSNDLLEHSLLANTAHQGQVTGLATIDEARIITSGWDGIVRLWQLNGKTLQPVFALNFPQPIRQMELSKDKRYLYVLCDSHRSIQQVDLDRAVSRANEVDIHLQK